ncbi:hypothetical protein [Cryptosporangium sp. NPDC048952]|uniref:hypothetical protein n=1 Tax=Cryptosporangium sp. NPDC048952 TaxID=3363961 RepID=UPI0037142352
MITSEVDAAYRDGSAAVLAFLERRLAERVEILHEPPMPADGTYDRDVVLAAHAQQEATKQRVLADLYEHADVSGDDTEVVVALRVTGRLPDGNELTIVGTDTLTVVDGRVVRLHSAFDPSQMQPLSGSASG